MKNLLLLALSGSLHAQVIPDPDSLSLPDTANLVGSLGLSDWNDVIGNIETIDIVTLSKLDKTPGFKRFADELTIMPKIFEVEGEDSSLGLTWAYSKTLNKFDSKDITEGYQWKIESEGNVAFDNKVNPRDFIKFNTNYGYFRSMGGVASKGIPSDAVIRYRFKKAEALAKAEHGSPEYEKLANENLDDFRSNFTPQIYFGLKGNLGYESDQDFTNQQFTLGLAASIDIKSLNHESALAKYNILDMPFAVTRWITGSSFHIRPSGAYLPTFRVGLDSVTPTETSITYRGGDSSNFFRVSAEVFNRSLVADLGEPIYFESSVKYYKELSPSSSIKSLGEDEKTLVTFALLLPNNTYVSYSHGSLPFDQKDEEVFEVGFKWQY